MSSSALFRHGVHNIAGFIYQLKGFCRTWVTFTFIFCTYELQRFKLSSTATSGGSQDLQQPFKTGAEAPQHLADFNSFSLIHEQ